MCVFVIERTRDLIYLKFVTTDFFPKTIGHGARQLFSTLSIAVMEMCIGELRASGEIMHFIRDRVGNLVFSVILRKRGKM